MQLKILGGFALLQDGRELSVGGAKQKALLAYLALQGGRPVARELLADLLWGDRFEQQARQSLRQALFRLKQNLAEAGADILDLRDTAVALAMDKLVVDVLVFQATAAADPATMDPTAGAPRYHRLLDGLSVPNASFEDWLTGERGRLQDLAGDVYDRFSAAHIADQPKTALAAAEAWIALDPLNEAARCRAMEIDLARGERVAALQRFKALSAGLQRELGIEPGAAAKSLAAAARAGDGDAADRATRAIEPAGPGLPVVAVLPFENLSGDPEQDYFAAGIVDEIITALSLSSEFITLSPNAAAELVARGLGPFAVARELGARYTVQGGVRTSQPFVICSMEILARPLTSAGKPSMRRPIVPCFAAS